MKNFPFLRQKKEKEKQKKAKSSSTSSGSRTAAAPKSSSKKESGSKMASANKKITGENDDSLRCRMKSCQSSDADTFFSPISLLLKCPDNPLTS